MKLRPPLAVVLSRFPLLTETFILREIEELERQGQPVRLVPLLRERAGVVHHEAHPWLERALYTPYLSPAILAANARALRRAPGRYLGLLARLVAGTLTSANLLVRTLALFPKCVYLAERLRAEGAFHVHAHFATHPATAALVISALTGLPFSFTVHAHDLFVRRQLLEEKLRRAGFARSISRFNRELLRRLSPDLADERLPVIHVGVDPAAYEEEPLDGRGRAPLVLCVAALKPYKGLPVLVQACRILGERGVPFRCDVVGDGPLRAEIERLIVAAGLARELRLLGPKRQDEVAALLPGARVVVLPSVRASDGQMEGIPVALMEAMAARRPVVATSLSGVPELVEDGVSGLLVPPGDADALAGAVARLLADPALCHRLGEQGRAKVEREFRLTDVAAALLERIDGLAHPVGAELDPSVAAGVSGAEEPTVVGVRRLHERPDSVVAELLLPAGASPRERVLKRHRGRHASDAARRETAALEHLERVFADAPGFGVPRLVCPRAAGAGLLMERSRGRPLVDLVRAGRVRGSAAERERLEDALLRTGRWLRLLQERTRRGGDATTAVRALVHRAQRDLEACAGRVLAPEAALRIEARLGALAGRARPEAWLVGHHGDFWPGNVFVAEDRIEVIDLEGYREGLPAEDVAYFLVQLERFFAYPLVRRRFAPLRAAFLEGCGGGPVEDPPFFDLCRRAKALQVLAQSLGTESGRGPLAWWRRLSLVRMARGART